MTLLRMEHVGIVVDDLNGAKEFFSELGMELVGESPVEGHWVDKVVGLGDVRVEVAVMKTPDGHGQIELTKFHNPAASTLEPSAPANTLGIRRVMFAVEDIDDVLGCLQSHGGELIGELADFLGESAADGGSEANYRLCYVRGPEGIIVALSQRAV